MHEALPGTGAAVPRRPRVAIVSAVHPYPTDGGNKVVLAGLVRYFAERHGADAVSYVLVGPEPREPIPEPVHLRVVPRPGTARRLWGVTRRAVLGGASLQEGILWSPTTARRLRRVLADIEPDVVVLDTIRMAQYLDAVPESTRRTVCYVDDLYSERYRSMLDLVRDEPGVTVRPLASFAELIPRGLRRLTEWGPTQRRILRFESRRTAQSENRVARAVDTCLLVNDNETRRLRERVGGADIRTVVPLPQSIGGHAMRTHHGLPVFVIMGVLSGPHNDLAVRWLLSEVLPLLLRSVPQARIDVIGKNPSPEVTAMAAAAPGAVRLLGFVPDPLPHLTGACALLNPPRFASGIKLKVLDALAVGTPVVSTAAGADGLHTGAEHGVVIADSAAGFAAAMAELCDPVRNARVSAGARRHCTERFSRDAVFAQYDTLFPGPPNALAPTGPMRRPGVPVPTRATTTLR